jgi:hypothetical protein
MFRIQSKNIINHFGSNQLNSSKALHYLRKLIFQSNLKQLAKLHLGFLYTHEISPVKINIKRGNSKRPKQIFIV